MGATRGSDYPDLLTKQSRDKPDNKGTGMAGWMIFLEKKHTTG